ncbi:aminoglycoside phosphotransferase family protein [Streptomyces xanthophaeus]|uniref:aminoglycoside phosphotransferase family protein n=1 Tax=Streptomyces xanthophaeus TaxID=67385 RepID=UPI0036875EBE
MSNAAQPTVSTVREACTAAGLDPHGAELVRDAENEIWRLPAGVIIRIARPGQNEAAAREVRVARWLLAHSIRAVTPLSVKQPVIVADRPVTFWEGLPTHEHGGITDVAETLAQLHALPVPDFYLGQLDPFVRIRERLDAATSLAAHDRQWLLDLHDDLALHWAQGLPEGLPPRAIHGDAWPGNIVRVGEQSVLMDLERFSIGPPEWDLVSTAVRARTTGAVTPADYGRFCEVYGYDVTQWQGYGTLAGIRELRMVSYAAQHAARHPAWRNEAQHRVDCLRRRQGPRPWNWRGIM